MMYNVHTYYFNKENVCKSLKYVRVFTVERIIMYIK